MAGAAQGALTDMLGGLGPQKVEQLVLATERDRQTGSNTLPHALILDQIRPALRRLGRPVPRQLTPLRLFCLPFEDLLGAQVSSKKCKGRIARSSIGPVWNWLCEELFADRMPGLCETARLALMSGDERRVRDAATRLHGVGGLALSKALKTVPPGSPQAVELARHLGDSRVLEDARDMAMVLEIADDIQAMLSHLPRPIPDLEDRHIDVIRETYETIVRELPDHAPYVVFVAMGRLVKPWEGLRIMGRLTNRDTDTLVSQTDLGSCGELLLCDLDDTVAFFQSLDPKTADYDDIVHQLEFFARLTKGMSAEMEIVRDGEWGGRIKDARTVVSGTMEGVLGCAVGHIDLAVPQKGKVGPGGASAPDPAIHRRAEASAAFLNRIRYLAEPAAFSGAFTSVMSDLKNRLDAYIETVVEGLQAVKGGNDSEEQAKAPARAQAALASELFNQLMEREEAQPYLQRLRSALGKPDPAQPA